MRKFTKKRVGDHWEVIYYDQRRRRRKFCKSSREADDIIYLYRQNEKQHGHPEPNLGNDPGRRSIQSLFDEWYDYISSDTTLRPSSIPSYRNQPKRFVNAFGKRSADSIDKKEASRWLMAQKIAHNSKADMVRMVRMIYKHFEIDCPLDTPRKLGKKQVEFYSVEQAKSLLNACPDRFKGVLAAQLFTGVRPAEALRMTLDSFNFSQRYFRVDSDASKSGFPRTVKRIPETVWPWLETYGYNTTNAERTRKSIAAMVDFKWVKDGLRHSFITYMVALGRVEDAILAAGHLDFRTTQTYYVNQTVLPEDAEAFFNLKPASL